MAMNMQRYVVEVQLVRYSGWSAKALEMPTEDYLEWLCIARVQESARSEEELYINTLKWMKKYPKKVTCTFSRLSCSTNKERLLFSAIKIPSLRVEWLEMAKKS